MIAPKPAIRGNGHAAMQRTYNVDKHLMINEEKPQHKQTRKIEETKHKQSAQ